MKNIIKLLILVAAITGITACAELQQTTSTLNNSGILKIPAPAQKTAGSGISNVNKITTGTYYIINTGNQKALTLPRKEKFTTLALNDFNGSDLQKWEVIQLKNGKVQLKLYDSPNWYVYFSNSVVVSVNSENAENFSLKPATGTSNKFNLVTSTYAGKVLIWNGNPSGNGTGTAVLQNNKFDQWELVPVR